MLGPLEAWREEGRLTLGGLRQRSVLACLLLEPDQAVSSDRIVDAVWGERPPSGVQTSLQAYVFHPRGPRARAGQGGDRASSARSGGLSPAGRRRDDRCPAFEQLVAAGRSSVASDPATAAALLRTALGLWRGDVLSDLVSMNGLLAPVAAARRATSCGHRALGRRGDGTRSTRRARAPSTISSRGTRCASISPRCGCSPSIGPDARRTP